MIGAFCSPHCSDIDGWISQGHHSPANMKPPLTIANKYSQEEITLKVEMEYRLF